LSSCVLCGRPGETHHIIHRDEGGLDFPLNRITLCHVHHRGARGPHRDAERDLAFKRDLQHTLKELLPKEYYRAEELGKLLQLQSSLLRTLKKALKPHKEGYRSVDVLDFLLGGNHIPEEGDVAEIEE